MNELISQTEAERIARLEQALVRTKQGFIVFFGIACLAIAVGFIDVNRHADDSTIRVRRVEIVDSEGTVRGVFGLGSDVPMEQSATLRHSTENVQLLLWGSQVRDVPQLMMDESRLWINDRKTGRPRLAAGVTDQVAYIVCFDRDGNATFSGPSVSGLKEQLQRIHEVPGQRKQRKGLKERK